MTERKSHKTDQEIVLEEITVEVEVEVEVTVDDKERDDEEGDDETGEGTAVMGPTSSPPNITGRSATVGDFGTSPVGGTNKDPLGVCGPNKGPWVRLDKLSDISKNFYHRREEHQNSYD